MATYVYDVEFIDEQSGESFIARREYDEKMEWEGIWNDFVNTGDLQMVPHLMWVDEEEE